jgi:phosphatidate phosphatase APP1
MAFAETRFVVVSDLDDTIKETHVGSAAAAFWNGLFTARAFTGMNALFTEWKHTSDIYVVTGSPGLLGKRVKHFLKVNHFPEVAKIYTRNWFTNFDLVKYKTGVLEKLASERDESFILLGDDTEHDPEIYQAFQKKHPERVLRIYIHRITGRALPEGVTPILTSYDIADRERLDGRLTDAQVDGVGQVILDEPHFDQVVSGYGICPTDAPADGDIIDPILYRVHERVYRECQVRASAN